MAPRTALYETLVGATPDARSWAKTSSAASASDARAQAVMAELYDTASGATPRPAMSPSNRRASTASPAAPAPAMAAL